MRALVLVALVACAGGDSRPPPARRPTLPADAAAPASTPESNGKWSDLSGSITSVRVEGANDSLRTQVTTELAAANGKPIDPDHLRDALTRVMKLPGVADVTMQGVQISGGVELVVQVTMYPVMRKLTAIETGGKPIALGISAIPDNTMFDPHRIQTLVASLRDRYLGIGHFTADVTWRRVDVANGVEVVIEVTPGPASTIGSVTFQGNTVATKVLAAQVATLLVVGQPVLDDKIGSAADAIARYYWDVGYANVKVNSPKPVAGPNTLVFKIEEGPVFKLGPIDVKGDLPDEHARLLKLFGVKKGDVFSRTKIADGRQRVVDALVAAGRPDAEVLPLTKVDLPNKTISLTLEIAAGPKP